VLSEGLASLDASVLPAPVREQIESLTRPGLQGGVHDVSDTLLELAEIIEEGLSRTSSLVTGLRDFAAPGRAGVRSAGVDLAKGLGSTLQLLKHALDDRGARVELDVESELPTIVADLGGLNQVFLNLVKNAIEAFEEPGGTIRIGLRRDGDRVRIEVADDGPGIPSEHLGELFEPFFTTKAAGEGTGLGLSISRQIVIAHGGALDVTSRPGQGTCFTILLPVEGPVGRDGVRPAAPRRDR